MIKIIISLCMLLLYTQWTLCSTILAWIRQNKKSNKVHFFPTEFGQNRLSNSGVAIFERFSHIFDLQQFILDLEKKLTTWNSHISKRNRDYTIQASQRDIWNENKAPPPLPTVFGQLSHIYYLHTTILSHSARWDNPYDIYTCIHNFCTCTLTTKIDFLLFIFLRFKYI